MSSLINYFFEDTKTLKSSLPPKKWIKLCLSKENYSAGTLNFIFCSDDYLRRVNKQYLKKDYFTDVISFKNEYVDHRRPINSSHTVSGDIFISVDRVRENKKKYNASFSKELKRVMIHGALHLVGFNDTTKKGRGLMAEKENIYIELK